RIEDAGALHHAAGGAELLGRRGRGARGVDRGAYGALGTEGARRHAAGHGVAHPDPLSILAAAARPRGGTYASSVSNVSMRKVPAATRSSGWRVPIVRWVTIQVERSLFGSSLRWAWPSSKRATISFVLLRCVVFPPTRCSSPASVARASSSSSYPFNTG